MKQLTVTFVLACTLAIAWAADEDTQQQADVEVADSMTEEEVEAELQRIEEALGDDEELKEFVPSKPLAADLPIALPSDI